MSGTGLMIKGVWLVMKGGCRCVLIRDFMYSLVTRDSLKRDLFRAGIEIDFYKEIRFL